jgi:cytochrome P450
VPLTTLFTTRDEAFHSKLRRSINNAYTMSSLVQFEPLVDSTITELVTQMHSRYANQSGDTGLVDFGAWLQYFAFDVICELTYSKRIGFVERGADVEDILADLQKFVNYSAVVRLVYRTWRIHD